MTKQRRLGRGLEALLGMPLDQDFASSEGGVAVSEGAGEGFEASSDRQGGILELDVDLIDANPFQPRRTFHPEEIASLADSIKRHQQLQPVIVRRAGDRFQLISGERRLRATIHAGLTQIRAVIHEADDRLAAEIALIENLQRKDLNAIEKATSFKNYIQQHQCTQEELAKRLSIDRSTIANLMRLLELPQEILLSIQQDRLSAGHARALLPLGEENLQIKIAKQIQEEGWSVRATEMWVQEKLRADDADGSGDEAPKKAKAAPRTTSHHVASLEKNLRMSLGTRVDIRQTARGRGRIVVHFTSDDEFERIQELLLSATSTTITAAA